MSPIRRIISLIFALAITCGGAGLAIFTLTHGGGFNYKLMLAAGGLLGVGLYWLWADFFNTPRPEC